MGYDVIVVGGGSSGIIAALTAKSYYPEKSVLVVKSVGSGVIPCGIPYMVNTLAKPEDNALGNAALESNGIETRVAEVKSVDRQNKQVKTKKGETLSYKRLVLATGSSPVIPPIKGREKEGVRAIHKEMAYLKELKANVEKARDVVIVGGGFIGIEFADEISQMKGKNVTIVEMLPEILSNSFDAEFSKQAKENLERQGVKVVTGKGAERFEGKGKVESVTLSDKSRLPAQLVVMAIGAKPNSGLAEDAGIETGKNGGIQVNEYLKTSDSDVFAVGDCAEKRIFSQGKAST